MNYLQGESDKITNKAVGKKLEDNYYLKCKHFRNPNYCEFGNICPSVLPTFDCKDFE